MKGCSSGYVTNENSKQVCRTHAKLLCQIYDAFPLLGKVDPTCDSIREAGSFFAASMKTWRKLGLSVTQKSHTFEDHIIEYIQALNSLGDNNEAFI